VTAELRPFDLHRVADARPGQDGGMAGDGTPVAQAGTAPLRMTWMEAAIAAAAVVRNRPALVAVGLLGFLARGGLALFLLPIVVLPTPIGISNVIGGTALTGSGASDGLVRLIVAVVLLVLGLVALGVVVGAKADVMLARATLAALREGPGREESGRAVTGAARAGAGWSPADAGSDAGPPGSGSLVARLAVVRIVVLVPVAAAATWAASRLVAAGYHELILPDDLSVPLPIRILVGALDAAAVLTAVWLLAELLGGLAVRHVILTRRSIPGAIAASIAGCVRRPLTTGATWFLGLVVLIVTAGPTLVLAAALWNRLQVLLADAAPVVLLVPATFVFVLVWGGGLLLVGAGVTWRSVLGNLDMLRAGPTAGAAGPAGAAGSAGAAGAGPAHPVAFAGTSSEER
jgi:hypothetical protein